MQFSASQNPQNKQTRTVILLVVAGLVLLLLGLFLTSSREKVSNSPEGTGQYYDAASGETVSDPEGKSPETFGAEKDQIVFLGISDLLNKGATRYHAKAFRIAMEDFSKERAEKITEVSVYKDSIVQAPIERGSPKRKISFRTLVNRKQNYNVSLEYTDITSAQITLIEKNKVVFKSGSLDVLEEEYTGDGVPPEKQP